MKNEIEDYIDRMGGDWTVDFQYFRDVTKIYYQDLCAAYPYEQVAKNHRATYCAVQRGSSRAADSLRQTGAEMLCKDLGRTQMDYPGPLGLARCIARAVTRNKEDW